MLIIYRFLINLIFLLSPLILIFRLLKKKEDIRRFKEKFCIFSKKKKVETPMVSWSKCWRNTEYNTINRKT